MLAGFRIIPNEEEEKVYSPDNYNKLRAKILRVGKSQVVQVVWKLQLGALSDLYGQIGGSAERITWRVV